MLVRKICTIIGVIWQGLCQLPNFNHLYAAFLTTIRCRSYFRLAEVPSCAYQPLQSISRKLTSHGEDDEPRTLYEMCSFSEFLTTG